MKRNWVATLAATTALVAGLAGAQSGPVAHVAQGDVAGVTIDDVTSFKGIPFAAPPVGDLRWRPPTPPAAWSGVRDASAFGPACLQPAKPALAMSEDCLTLTLGAGPRDARREAGGHGVDLRRRLHRGRQRLPDL